MQAGTLPPRAAIAMRTYLDRRATPGARHDRELRADNRVNGSAVDVLIDVVLDFGVVELLVQVGKTRSVLGGRRKDVLAVVDERSLPHPARVRDEDGRL